MLRSLCLRLPLARMPSKASPASLKYSVIGNELSHFSRSFATEEKGVTAKPSETTVEEEDFFEEDNALEGKRTRENIHKAFSNRAMDVIRYDYFAQRAELEAELEAASTFRSLTEMAKQQAMGYLEMMEEYGDAEFGSTIDNIELSAAAERDNAEEVYSSNGVVAAEEDLEQLRDWFEDMSAASTRAASRLELVSSMIEAEDMEEDMDEEEDAPGNVKG